MTESPTVSGSRFLACIPRWFVVAPLLIIAGAWFSYRGPVMAVVHGGNDFALIYIQARAWAGGLNPYDAPALDRVWDEAGGTPNLRPTTRGEHDLLYPPPSLLLLSPVAASSWPVASVLWIVVTTVCYGGALLLIARMMGLVRGTWGWWIFVLLGLLLAPSHTAIRMGQTTLPLLLLLAGTHDARLRNRPIVGGVLLGLACALKPQVGVPFLAYECFRMRWRTAGTAAVVAGVVATASIVRLEAAGALWLETLAENVRRFSVGGPGDPSLGNPLRYQMLHLAVLWHAAVADHRVVGWLVRGTLAVIALGAFVVWTRHDEGKREGIAISLGVVLCLLVVYHRFYDAALLTIPMAWALGVMSGVGAGSVRRAASVLALALAFLVPGPAVLYIGAQRGMFPSWLVDGRLWQPLFISHQVWLLLVLAVLLIVALAGSVRRGSPERDRR